MKTSHSSLLADTGLSEIELDRMGLTPVERDGEQLSPTPGSLFHATDRQMHLLGIMHSETLAPYKGTHWYEDEDVKILDQYIPRPRRKRTRR